ncbi:DEAD/DEAH box helicase [Stetteria hydrogenophila]
MEALRASTGEVLRTYGFHFEVYEEPGSEPPLSGLAFESVHPGFSGTHLRGARLYVHQERVYRALLDGFNVVLSGEPGSGKTEAWVAAVAAWVRMGVRPRVLVVYPSLRGAASKYYRLYAYSESLGFNMYSVLEEVALEEGVVTRRSVVDADVLVVKARILLEEFKRHLAKPGSSVLSPAFDSVRLLVLDELHRYEPRSIALLLGVAELLAAARGGELQVAVLSPLLSNPGELASHLEGVTGRPSLAVEAAPRRPANTVYIIVGKTLEEARRVALEALEGLECVPGDVAEAARDPGRFREEAYKVVAYLRSRGARAPRVAPQPRRGRGPPRVVRQGQGRPPRRHAGGDEDRVGGEDSG